MSATLAELSKNLAVSLLDSVVLLTPPQQIISLSDVRRKISFCKKANLTIFGVAENLNKLGSLSYCQNIKVLIELV